MLVEPLDLHHQPLLENKLPTLNLNISEYSFANLYLFRNIHQYELLQIENEIFIKGITRDGMSFIMLTTPPKNLSISLLKSALSHAQMLFPIPETWISSLKKFLAQANFRTEETDYLFKASKLAIYPGRHLSKKRNLVKQFVNSYQIEEKILTVHTIKNAQQILTQWQNQEELPPQETDYFPCQEALKHLEILHLNGHLIYIDGLPVGFSIGEWINSHCYAVHFLKGVPAIKGLYQYLYQSLAQKLNSPTSWINLEQDLGLLNIRKAKHSYHPDDLLHKWRVLLQFE